MTPSRAITCAKPEHLALPWRCHGAAMALPGGAHPKSYSITYSSLTLAKFVVY